MPLRLPTSSPVFLIAAVCTAQVLAQLGAFTFFALLPTFFQEWGLSHSQAGILNGIIFGAYALIVPFVVPLTDRIDPRRIYICAVVLTTFSHLGMAFIADGFWDGFVFRALAGIGWGGTYMVGLKALADLVEGPTQSRAVAFHAASIGIGGSLSFVLAGWAADSVSWQTAFQISAAGSFLALLVMAFLVPRRTPVPLDDQGWLSTFIRALKNKSAIAYSLGYLVHTWEMFTLRSWVVTFLVFTAAQEGGPPNFLIPTVIAMLMELTGTASSVFGNEVAITTQEAYERDSEYWAGTRTEELDDREARLIRLRDSIQAVHNSPAYRDSLEGLYNRVSLLEIAWDGIGIRDWREQSHLYVSSLASMIDFSPVGGWRVGPYVSRFKRYQNGKIWSNSGTLNFGLRNHDIQGDFSSWFRYDPFRLGDLSISGGRSFQAINEFDAYLNLLRPSNYILLDAVRATHAIEIANGLRIHTSFDWNDRRPITTYDVGSFLGDVVEDDDSPMDFERYQAFITTNTLSFTPGQRYMREPNRKVILGSKWPTLSLMHRRGWDKTFGSDIRFDYLEASLEQEIILGPIGNTHYRAQLGQFVNTEDLRFVDWKQFRESDPILYSNPLRTFQMLDTSLATTNLHFELHFIHHFNGAIINNIPLLKKTRIKTVAGGGVLWLKDGDYRHQEVFAGIERVFKVGPRRRLRVGLFGVLADANNRKPDTSFKISFDLIDVWKRDWSY